MTELLSAKLAIDGGDPVRAKPYPHWPNIFDDEKEEVQKVLNENKINYWSGDRGKTFQKKFAEFHDCKHGVALNSGTSALHVALAAMELGPGDEVIVPARTFIATAFACLHQMTVPVFCDVELDTHCLSAETIKPHLTERTRGIICVHLAGHPCDMDPIMALAEERGIKVIEDCAQAHGATYKGRKAGSLGHIAAFSFCQDKHFTTGGEGGLVTTNDDKAAEIAFSFKDHGWSEEERTNLLKTEALKQYIHHRMGYNYRMTEMQSAIGLKALEKLEWNVRRRRENAAYLTENLAGNDALITPVEEYDTVPSYYKYYLRLQLDKLNCNLGKFVKSVQAEGVPCVIGSTSEDHLEEAFQNHVGFGKTGYPWKCPLYPEPFDYSKVNLPNCHQLALDAFNTQVHPTVQKTDLDDFIAAVNKVTDAYRK